MRKEIGSEYWDVPIADTNNIFSKKMEWFVSGRSALQAIIEENSFASVALPDWCCESIIKPFVDKGIEIFFYPALGLHESENVINADVLVVMDYFGYTGYSKKNNFKGVIIRDVTHSIFSADYDDADYYFGSLRKWTGVFTGGYAWGFKKPVKYADNTTSYVRLRKSAMDDKAAYIKGEKDNKEYLQIFAEAEEQLEYAGIFPAVDRDIEVAQKLDVNFIVEQRRKNARILLDAFSDIAIFADLKDTDCPLFVPIRVRDRDGLRRYLIENEIYCPIHWPKSKYHGAIVANEAIYEQELSLICDQRYTECDMLRMVDIIKQFWKKGE